MFSCLARFFSLSAQQSRPRSETVGSTGATTYCLTPVTLEYLDSRLSLVATLASVTCKEVDEIQQSRLDIHFPDHTPQTADDVREAYIRDADSVRQFRSKKLALCYHELSRYLSSQALGCLSSENDAEVTHAAFTRPTNDDDVKLAMLSSAMSLQSQASVVALIEELLSQQKWANIVRLLQCSPALNAFEAVNWTNLKDIALSCCGVRVAESNDENWRLLLQISDAATRVRIILSSLGRWSVDVCIELLKACCCCAEPPGEELALLVEMKLKEMMLYQQVRRADDLFLFPSCIGQHLLYLHRWLRFPNNLCFV